MFVCEKAQLRLFQEKLNVRYLQQQDPLGIQLSVNGFKKSFWIKDVLEIELRDDRVVDPIGNSVRKVALHKFGRRKSLSGGSDPIGRINSRIGGRKSKQKRNSFARGASNLQQLATFHQLFAGEMLGKVRKRLAVVRSHCFGAVDDIMIVVDLINESLQPLIDAVLLEMPTLRAGCQMQRRTSNRLRDLRGQWNKVGRVILNREHLNTRSRVANCAKEW